MQKSNPPDWDNYEIYKAIDLYFVMKEKELNREKVEDFLKRKKGKALFRLVND